MNNGQIEQTQGPLRFELFIEMMSNQLNLLKNETARYELIETQNEKLNQDLEVTRLERESIRKTLTVSWATLPLIKWSREARNECSLCARAKPIEDLNNLHFLYSQFLFSNSVKQKSFLEYSACCCKVS